MTCLKKEAVCVYQVETCIRYEAASNTGECLSTRNECKTFVDTCQDWEYSCTGDSVTTCEEFEIVDDESTCLEYGWDCREVDIPDPQCQMDCDIKKTQYNKLNEIYTTIKAKYDALKVEQAKFIELITLLNNPDQSPFQVDSLKFAVEADKPLTVGELPWTLTYSYLGKQRTVDVAGLSLVDKRETLNQVYQGISRQLAGEYGIEWFSVEDFGDYIRRKLEINNETRLFFLQLLNKVANSKQIVF